MSFFVLMGFFKGDLIWLVVEPTRLKNMSSSVGMMTFTIYGKMKAMFQTTNQSLRLFVLMGFNMGLIIWDFTGF